jgi:hypothetical protein
MEEPMANTQRANNQDANKGDNRTPDKTIGQVNYADHHGDQKNEKLGSDKKNAQKSQNEGPAAYAPHEDEPTKPKGAGR